MYVCVTSLLAFYMYKRNDEAETKNNNIQKTDLIMHFKDSFLFHSKLSKHLRRYFRYSRDTESIYHLVYKEKRKFTQNREIEGNAQDNIT